MALRKIGIHDSFELTYITFEQSQYESQLQTKIAHVRSLLGDLLDSLDPADPNNFTIISSPTIHLRHRCRFTILHSNPPEDSVDRTPILGYCLWEGGSASVLIDHFPIASISIYEAMPALLAYVQTNPTLRDNLKAVNFLSTTVGELIATLVYDEPIEESSWRVQGLALQSHLLAAGLPSITAVSIIGRSKKVKVLCGSDRVREQFRLSDGRVVQYNQVEDGFSNPNAAVNAKALEWICSAIKYSASRIRAGTAATTAAVTNTSSEGVVGEGDVDGEREVKGEGEADGEGEGEGEEVPSRPDDCSFNVLELYCGNGNHTVGIAGYCRRIVSVEINKSLCVAANENLALNGITNATVVAGDSQQFALRVLRNKCWEIRSTGERIQFDVVLVDPPRCGLDVDTCRLVALYDHVVYISCSPEALARDLSVLKATHKVTRFAVFDQFAYTPHLESGVLLSKL